MKIRDITILVLLFLLTVNGSVFAMAPFEFKPLSFSGSVLRDGIFPAYGLQSREIVGNYLDLKVKPPKALADKEIKTKEANFGIGLPIKGVYLRWFENESDIVGTARKWKVKAEEMTVGYRFKQSETGNSAFAVEYSDREIDSGSILFKATGAEEIKFLAKGKIQSFKLVHSREKGENSYIHLMLGMSKAEYSSLSNKSSFAGFGVDRLLNKRLDWQNTAVFINSENRPKNFYLSSRFVYRLFKGLSLSVEGSMYTKGYTYAPFRFADHFVPAMAVSPTRLPSSMKTLEDSAFGFYGVGLHYGFKF